MPWLQFKADVADTYAEQLSDCLITLGASAVTFEDAARQPVFEPPPGETRLWQTTRVVGLFTADTDMDLITAALDNALNVPLANIKVDILEDQEWSRSWLTHFKPTRFGERLWVIPSDFAPPDPNGVNLHLDPGLAFGTGTHPTTSLCLKWLDGHPPDGLTVIDYGCGSGILAVAAALLGAREIHAVDHDPQALTATRSNAAKNGVADKVRTYLPNERPAIKADLILANILANPLVGLQPLFVELIRPAGQIVLSGILHSQAEHVVACYRHQFEIADIQVDQDWCRIIGTRLAANRVPPA